ncbi:cytochrome P450, partial [Aureobasidium melanogenum]
MASVPTLYAFLWLSVTWILYKTISLLYIRRQHAIKSRKLACEPAPLWPATNLGISTIKQMMAAQKAGRFPAYLREREEALSESHNRPVHTMRLSILGNEAHFTSDPKNIQALLATQFKDFGLGSARIGNFGPLMGDGIFASDGKRWEHSRALLRPQFARDNISDLELEEVHVQNMMQALPANADGWVEETNVQLLFFRLTLDSSTEFLFGESIDTQLAALRGGEASAAAAWRDEKVFGTAIDSSQSYLFKGARFGNYYWMAHDKHFKKLCKDVHNFADYYVDKAIKAQASEKRRPSLTRKFVFLEELAAQTQDPVELRTQLLNILIAGRDTTACLLSWMLLLLAKNLDVFEKLRETVIRDFGSYENPRDITFVSLKDCQYLQHCLNEALRVYPVVPMDGRRALRDTTIPRGGGTDGLSPIFIPKGTDVSYSVYVMHRRKDIWGEDADEFKPSRWTSKRPSWDYLPFNGGPRICIGQQFALTEASYVMVRLLQRFDKIEPTGPTLDVEPKMRLTLTCCPADGVWVKMRQVKDVTSH